MAKNKKATGDVAGQMVERDTTVINQASLNKFDADMSLKEIERIGLGKRNLTNEMIRVEKNKKRKKKFFISTGVFLLFIIIGTFYWYTQIRETETEVESSDNIQVASNQELVLGQITVINGNEMTFVLVEESENTESTSQQTERGTRLPMADETASGETVSGEMPTGEMPAGEMPAGETSAGEMPAGEMPTGEIPTEETSESSDVTYTALDEERTMVIPVGTEVVTKLGTVTTFSRLASGDVMKILTEKSGDEDVILKIWIVG